MPDIKAAVEKLGKFQILEPLTEGQNVYSFKARHIHLNRPVFLKLYDYVDSMVNDVLREPQAIVAAMRMFRSENVVELFDAEVVEIEEDKYLAFKWNLWKGKAFCH
jgi:hypothetical protein